MSEIRVPYKAGKEALTALSDFKDLRCVLPFSEPDYTPPTTEQLCELIALAGWSQNEVAKITGVSYNPKKGSTTVRKWKAPLGNPEHRDIPYSAWRLLLINAGIVLK